jgi:hypothetical protein
MNHLKGRNIILGAGVGARQGKSDSFGGQRNGIDHEGH